MPRLDQGILSAIGNTPLVELHRVFGQLPFRIFAKLEGCNFGGSIKDRPAIEMLRHAIENGQVGPDTVIVESSSGNLAIGLAQACCCLGLRLICVVDARTTARNIEILHAFGIEVEIVREPDPETGEYLPARLRRVKDIVASIPNSYWPNQYANPNNPRVHFISTMPEIVRQLGADPDFLFCAASTCGTLAGCSEFVRKNGLRTKIIGVDAKGSVIFGGRAGPRKIPGHGAAIAPPLCDWDDIDGCIHVSDLECVIGCRMLARREGILAGGSSGAVLMAVARMREELPPGANCVLIFPDRGERYLDTLYSDSWVAAHFGSAPEIGLKPFPEARLA
jgi:cysteine synthase A